MDRTPNLQPQFDPDFFQSFQLANSLTIPDNMESNRRKLSFNNFESPSLRFRPNPFGDFPDFTHLENMSFLLPHKDEDPHFNPLAQQRMDATGHWQPSNVHNLLDYSFDPGFALKEIEMGLDPYQIRSRAGSFNFGRIRKDSEDLFHTHPDLFKHIRNLTDHRLHMENNSLRKQSMNLQDLQQVKAANDVSMMTQPDMLLQQQMMQAPLVNFQGIYGHMNNIPHELMASFQNTDSTTDGDIPDMDKIKKKKMLNDRSAEIVEKTAKEDSNAKSKQGTSDNASNQKPKPKKTPVPNSTKGKETSLVKTEDTNTGKVKVPNGNVEDLLGGFNLPDDIKDYLMKNSSVMAQIPWLENRKIGTLTVAERKAKIEKYMEKRKNRTWNRRINYDCRKRVADSRLRIKGRFVTRDQAFVLLNEAGIPYDPETITNDEIKLLLTEKAGAGAPKKGSGEKKMKEDDGEDGESDNDE